MKSLRDFSLKNSLKAGVTALFTANDQIASVVMRRSQVKDCVYRRILAGYL